MATVQAIKATFARLTSAGYSPPRGTDPLKMLEAWEGILWEVKDTRLEIMLEAWLKLGKEFWPKPGELLHAVHNYQPPAFYEPEPEPELPPFDREAFRQMLRDVAGIDLDDAEQRARARLARPEKE